MAGGALSRADTGVIKGGGGEACETGVTAVARGRGGNMARRLALGVHAGERTVVAVRALSREDTLHGRVAERRGRERPVHGVACVARSRCWYVVRRLASCRDAVAGCAGARGHADMVEASAHPGGRAMARVAGSGGHDMVGWLARGHAAVMALSALTYGDTRVAEPDDAP